MRKRFLGMTLMLTAIVAVLCLNTDKAQAATEHTHPVCGSTCHCSDTSHEDSTWQPWDGTTKMYNGDYYLTKDIVLTKTMILDYSYSSRLCLNGHSITCENMVFDIYSYRQLLITDCVGTGKVETTNASCTIGNNKYLSVWGGTIINSSKGLGISSAVNAYRGTFTYVCGNGRVESTENDAIYAYPGCKVRIEGGTVHGGGDYGYALTGHDDSTTSLSEIKISGGRVTTEKSRVAMDVQNGKFIMTGGYVGGHIELYDQSATATVSGGMIDGILYTYCKSAEINGGDMSVYLDCESTVNAGTFRGSCYLGGGNVTVTGGDFSNCDSVTIWGNTWICGGKFNNLDVPYGTLYLSGVPEINQLSVKKYASLSAQSIDGTGSYGGGNVDVVLYGTYPNDWSDAETVVKNVTSDAVAEKFVLTGEDLQWKYLKRTGNNLVLRILPHGQWGSATWGIRDGTLTISGTGALNYTHSGTQYPWGSYVNDIKTIVVEPGITKIPSYAFEYCENVTSIALPDTLTDLALNAFNDCGSLNNLLLPGSLVALSGTSNTGYPAFLRCESLTDVYFLGTAEQWAEVIYSNHVTSANSKMQMHFLQLHPATGSCTEDAMPAYYRFDDTSVYDSYYDLQMQPMTPPEATPAPGHRVVVEGEWAVTPVVIDNTGSVPFVLTDGVYYSNNHAHNSSASMTVTAQYACQLQLVCGASSESRYDKLAVLYNGKVKQEYSGTVSGKSLTLNLAVGDVVTIRYSKDSSYSSGSDQGWVQLVYDDVMLWERREIDAQTLTPTCTEAVVCDFCSAVVKEALGHDPIFHEGKRPTATEIGWKDYQTCSRCDHTTYEELPLRQVTADINGDGGVSNDDVVYLLWHVLFPQEYPMEKEADMNNDGAVTNEDVMLLLWHTLFPEQFPIE